MKLNVWVGVAIGIVIARPHGQRRLSNNSTITMSSVGDRTISTSGTL
jgi:hypothetical protein